MYTTTLLSASCSHVTALWVEIGLSLFLIDIYFRTLSLVGFCDHVVPHSQIIDTLARNCLLCISVISSAIAVLGSLCRRLQLRRKTGGQHANISPIETATRKLLLEGIRSCSADL